jgi:methylated-DNA-protein-cysteine methyltransferase-like protein
MAALRPGSRVPWQRVVNAKGEVSPRAEPGAERIQRALLEREGVRFDAAGRIALERFSWRPRAPARHAVSRVRGGGRLPSRSVKP